MSTYTFEQVRAMTREEKERVVAEIMNVPPFGWQMCATAAFILEQKVRETYQSVSITSYSKWWQVVVQNGPDFSLWPRSVDPVELRYDLFILTMQGEG